MDKLDRFYAAENRRLNPGHKTVAGELAKTSNFGTFSLYGDIYQNENGQAIFLGTKDRSTGLIVSTDTYSNWMLAA